MAVAVVRPVGLVLFFLAEVESQCVGMTLARANTTRIGNDQSTVEEGCGVTLTWRRVHANR